MDRKLAWIALNAVPSLTPKRLRLLLRAFESPREILAAGVDELAGAIGREAAERFVAEKAQFDPERELARAEGAGARVITIEDADYPEALRPLSVPPLVLYVLGELSPRDERAIAIVGTRRATSYGRLVAKRLAEELAARGITVVSGLAPGIDTAAHRGALAAGRTVAVLGTGLGRPYPAGSGALMEGIAASGAVISEFPWECEGSRWTFPRRNRIVAALSRGVIVVEAPERSGALITAELALEQGKEVFAVPGPITSEVSRGTNRLIQEGAKLVVCVEDVLEEFPDLEVSPREAVEAESNLDEVARRVYGALAGEPLSAEEIVGRTGLPYAAVAKALLELSLAGLIQETPGGRYLRMGLG